MDVTITPSDGSLRPRRGLRATLALLLLAVALLACGLAGLGAAVRTAFWAEACLTLLGLLGLLGGALALGRARAAQGRLTRQRELEQAKRDFVSTVSHELRTPLTSIVGYLELLDGGELGELALAPVQRHALDVVGRNSRRLLGLLDDLQVLSRIESGAFALELLPVELAPLVERVRRAVAPGLARRRLELVVEVPPEPLLLLGDAAQLDRALLGVVGNAVKFSPEGGRIELRACRAGHLARFDVTDHGQGIPPQEQPMLFNRFFRGAGARSEAIQGAGLGLAIVKHIVEGHGGTVTVESAPGAGTVVRLTLPLARRPRGGRAWQRRLLEEPGAFREPRDGGYSQSP